MRVIIIFACLAITRGELLKLSCGQIRNFVDAHNNVRSKVLRGQLKDQPAAREMNHIVWDEELARKAEKWASKNLVKHNPDKTIGSKRFQTGENLYFWSTTNLKHSPKSPTEVTNAWAAENTHYKYSQLGRSGNRKTGHYTQVVWSTTTYIGCAISKYQKNGFNHFLYICNYGPAGNYRGKYPYSKDKGHSRRKGKGKPKQKWLKCIGKTCTKPYGPKC